MASFRLKDLVDVDRHEDTLIAGAIERQDQRPIVHWTVDASKDATLVLAEDDMLHEISGRLNRMTSRGDRCQLERIGYAILLEDGRLLMATSDHERARSNDRSTFTLARAKRGRPEKTNRETPPRRPPRPRRRVADDRSPRPPLQRCGHRQPKHVGKHHIAADARAQIRAFEHFTKKVIRPIRPRGCASSSSTTRTPPGTSIKRCAASSRLSSSPMVTCSSSKSRSPRRPTIGSPLYGNATLAAHAHDAKGRSCDGTSFTVPHAGHANVGRGTFFMFRAEGLPAGRAVRGDTRAVTPQMKADDPAAPSTKIEG